MAETHPAFKKEVLFSFKGMVKISDYDHCAKFVKYQGKYVCNNCGGKGSQIMTAWKAKFPKGIFAQDIEEQMLYSIKKNHVCHLIIH